MANHLYYGDNLQVLRESIRDESVDLIYLDPPFNSNANYNVLFRGLRAIEPGANRGVRGHLALEQRGRAGLRRVWGPNPDVEQMVEALHSFLRKNSP